MMDGKSEEHDGSTIATTCMESYDMTIAKWYLFSNLCTS